MSINMTAVGPATASPPRHGEGGFQRFVCQIASAFETAVAARHVYDGLVANHVARDKAATMTRDMLFSGDRCR